MIIQVTKKDIEKAANYRGSNFAFNCPVANAIKRRFSKNEISVCQSYDYSNPETNIEYTRICFNNDYLHIIKIFDKKVINFVNQIDRSHKTKYEGIKPIRFKLNLIDGIVVKP